MLNDNGKTALITGASKGLGLALARALSTRGWRLIIDARNSQRLREVAESLAELTEVTAVGGDVADPGHRLDLAKAAGEAGGLNAIVNNAGVLGPSPQPLLLDYPLDTLASVFQTNVIAPLGILQTLRPHLNRGVRIINVTSDAAVESYEGWGGYGASKAALEQLSAILAAEVKSYDPTARVYWIDPGDMRTQMHQDAFPGEDISDRPLPEVSVPAFISLLEDGWESGRYQARALLGQRVV